MTTRKRVHPHDLPEVRQKEDLDDLLVFGYHCKLFRDDERAAGIDEGKHLIPWMGDSSLLIDRYDGRGHLHDLRPYDADNQKGKNYEMTEEEQQIEALCDEERYLELHVDIQEKMTYEEEDVKRGGHQSGYSAVGFSYDQPQPPADNSETQQTDTTVDDADSEPYVPIPELQMPTTLPAPATMKQHAIIEKTASFISLHGSQMEIVIKTKQKNNPQFNFLNFDSELNAYYKHVVAAIKSGRYKPRPQSKSNTENTSENSGYLHPSLSKAVTQVETATSRQEFLTSVSAKLPAGQIANTPYAKLLSNLTKHHRSASPEPNTLMSNLQQGNGDHTNNFPQQYAANYEAEETQPVVHSIPGQPPPPGTEPPAPLPAQPLNEQKDYDSDDVLVPPLETQPIIDKMADYVARNGPEFEVIVRAKKDDRFHFLEDWHPYHPYYLKMKNSILKSKDGPVSFSIKAKEPEVTGAAELRSVLPYDDSSDEENNKIEDNGLFDICPPPPPPTELPPPPIPKGPPPVDERKLAQERLRDKLANAAREKLAQAAKEKALQAERKKKAAMFLSLVGKNAPPVVTPDSNTDLPVQGPAVPPPSLRVQESSVEATAIPHVASHPNLVPSRSHSRSPQRSRSHSRPLYRRSRSRSRSSGRSKRSHHRSSHRRRSRSRSRSRRSRRKKHSRSRSRERRSKRSRKSPYRRSKRRRRSKSRSRSSSSESQKRSVSPKFRAIPELKKSHSSESETSPHSSDEQKPPEVESNGALDLPPANKVSSDLLTKVRAMLKASREAVLKEEQLESSLPSAPPIQSKSSDSDSS